jgi:SAM-dependent methyltransferase
LLPHIGTDVLEVGAGLGLVTERLVAAGRRVTALEPDPSLHARIGQRAGGATVLNATLATSGLAGTFDTVLYVNVLEHIEDDTGELVRARGMLRDGGNVVIFVPAMPSLYGTMDAVSGHHRRYRRRELSSVIRSAGLRPVWVRSFDAAGIVPYWLAYRVVRRKVLGGAAVGVYDRVIIPLSRAVSRMTGRRGPGKNLIAVGSSAA